jgi:glutathione S-transferase
MSDAETVLVGRSSSHFTRTARIFALELGVPHVFRAVLDLTSTDPKVYGDNPALKVPVLVDGEGSLFGAENICRELARRSGRPGVVLRGDVGARIVANTEELILHAMGAGVILITTALAGPDRPDPPKVRPSLENALGFLERNLDRALAALPGDRVLSFCETSLFCLLTHLPWRKVMDVSGYARLGEFCRSFAHREAARMTEYRFDRAALLEGQVPAGR